jgi:uncharacterized protein YqjF (DUF2071 family)
MAPVPELVIDRLAPSRRPDRRPVMYQSWRSLLFLHWVVPPEELRPLLPSGLEIDTFEGRAYVGLVAFTMRGVRPAGLPAVSWLSDFHETNVRTYVHVAGREPGVWFFSLDAASRLAVALARAWFGLPYFYARMQVVPTPRPGPARGEAVGGEVAYRSQRLSSPPGRATTALRCAPRGAPAPAASGSLDHFLIERYLLYTSSRGRIHSGRVHHSSYPIQSADLLECEESLLAEAGVNRRDQPPIVHFSGGVDVEIFSLQACVRS